MSAGAAALPPLPPPQAASGTRSAAAAMPASVLVTLLKDTMFASFSCSYRSTVRDGGGSSAIPPSATPGTPLRVSSVIAKGFSHYTPFFLFCKIAFATLSNPQKQTHLQTPSHAVTARTPAITTFPPRNQHCNRTKTLSNQHSHNIWNPCAHEMKIVHYESIFLFFPRLTFLEYPPPVRKSFRILFFLPYNGGQ